MSVISAVNAKIEYAAYTAGTGGGSATEPTTWLSAVDCGGWTLDTAVDIKAYISCSTAGNKQKVVGARDFKGTLTYFYNNAGQNLLSPSGAGFQEGKYFWFKLWVDQSANPANAGGTHEDSYVIVPALISSIKLAANVDSSDPVKYSIDFEGNGVPDFTNWK